MDKKKITKKDIKRYKDIIDKGLSNYLLKYAIKTGLIFGCFMFLFDYFIWKNVHSIVSYLFYSIFFGLSMGLWSWHYMKKRIKER